MRSIAGRYEFLEADIPATCEGAARIPLPCEGAKQSGVARYLGLGRSAIVSNTAWSKHVQNLDSVEHFSAPGAVQ